MAGTSSASRPSTHDDHLLVDDFYFSALHDADELLPISDEKYAEELQLQEALYSSAISITRVKNEVMKVDVKVEVDTHLIAPLIKVKEEKVDLFFCAICMDSKPAAEIFRSQNCSHSFCHYCITKYVAAKIQENISMVKCPDPKCREVLEPQNCRSIIPKDVFNRWENALCDNLVLGSHKFYCPFKDCPAMLVDDRPSTHDDHLLVDDFYFSALHDADELLPISDEKYAEELQLQEALYSSAISITRVKNEVMKVDVKVEVDTHLIAPLIKVKEEKVDLFFCAICMDSKPAAEIFRSQNCSHSFCHYCITKYVAAKIQENISMVKCPDPKCRGVLEPQNCRSIIPKDVFNRWENALCDNLVLGSHKFYCPFKDCSAMLVDDGNEVVTASECPHCNRMFCAQCKVSWHAGICCSEFQSLKEGEQGKEDLMVMELAKNKCWRRCSECKFFVEKNEGCSHISCRCGNQFCYTCGSSWSQDHVCESQ